MSSQVNLIDPIAQEIALLFPYANASNPHVVMRTWENPNMQCLEMHRIFANCVTCGNERGYQIGWAQIEQRRGYIGLPKDTNTYFCDSCYKKVNDFYDKVQRMPEEQRKKYNEMCNLILFGSHF